MSEWIRVEDRRPEVPCLLWDRCNGVKYATDLYEIKTEEYGNIYVSESIFQLLYDGNGLSKKQRDKWSQLILDGCVNSYKYWMPLPKPPEGESG